MALVLLDSCIPRMDLEKANTKEKSKPDDRSYQNKKKKSKKLVPNLLKGPQVLSSFSLNLFYIKFVYLS